MKHESRGDDKAPNQHPSQQGMTAGPQHVCGGRETHKPFDVGPRDFPFSQQLRWEITVKGEPRVGLAVVPKLTSEAIRSGIVVGFAMGAWVLLWVALPS